MTAHQDFDVVRDGLEIIDAGESLAFWDYPGDHATIDRRFQTTASLTLPTVAVRENICEQYGVYGPSFKFAENLVLWLR